MARRANFESEIDAALEAVGYMQGLSEAMSSKKYVASAVEYTTSILSRHFDSYLHNIARVAPSNFHHVYEYAPGEKAGDYALVGVPGAELWNHLNTGRGGTRITSFAFRPSVGYVPVDERLLVAGKSGKAVKQNAHVFTWKAMVMEYGAEVVIKPKNAKALAFPSSDAKDGIMFSKGPVRFIPGLGKTTGSFSKAYIYWYGSQAPNIFDSEIKPMLESDLDSDKEFAKISKIRGKKTVTIQPAVARGRAEARRKTGRIIGQYRDKAKAVRKRGRL